MRDGPDIEPESIDAHPKHAWQFSMRRLLLATFWAAAAAWAATVEESDSAM